MSRLSFKLLIKNRTNNLLTNRSKLLISRPKNLTSSQFAYCTSREEHRPEHAWRKPWNEREGEWYSSFNLFAPKNGGSPDIIRFLQQDIDLRPSKIRSWWQKRQEGQQLFDQRYISERHQMLGNDLATAHFIVHRGGAVRFVGSPHWLRMDEDEEYNLPSKYVPEVFLDAVDASGMNLHYDGLANIVGLRHLKLLKLSKCALMDDWCVDRISGEHAATLEVLDLSHCSLITERGLAVLARMRNLKELHIEGVATSPTARLTCLMLEELNPRLNIVGVSHPKQDLTQEQPQ